MRLCFFCFFFKQKTAYEMRISDWSSDVCSSDLANPAMGWRAIRIGLDRPALLRRQLRALLHAAAGRSLPVMFPLISDVAEFEASQALLQREIEREKDFRDRLPADIRIGKAACVGRVCRALSLPAVVETENRKNKQHTKNK